jgi:hypothetical protein
MGRYMMLYVTSLSELNPGEAAAFCLHCPQEVGQKLQRSTGLPFNSSTAVPFQNIRILNLFPYNLHK